MHAWPPALDADASGRVGRPAEAARNSGILRNDFSRSDDAMWYLIEDFFEQSWIMKLFIGWGWLCGLIMATSLAAPFFTG